MTKTRVRRLEKRAKQNAPVGKFFVCRCNNPDQSHNPGCPAIQAGAGDVVFVVVRADGVLSSK